KKAQALLAYLVVEPGEAHLRDKLAALLWGDSSDQRARHSLRQVLLALKQAVARNDTDLLHIAADTVAVDRRAVDVDVALFEQAPTPRPSTPGRTTIFRPTSASCRRSSSSSGTILSVRRLPRDAHMP